MRSQSEINALLINPGIVAVIRLERVADLPAVCEALVAGGITALEITLTIPGALAAMPDLLRRFSAAATVGAGSVTNVDSCRHALEAGAEFVVTPITRPEIAMVVHSRGRVVVMGAFTPTEAQTAHESGADFVKIFPAAVAGPNYIRMLRGPLPHLRIIPTGGIDLENAGEFFRAGCVALGVSTALISPDLVAGKNWAALTRRTAEFVEIARQRAVGQEK